MNRLEAIRAREQAATPGPWYPKATDDALCMNARYVSLVPGEWEHEPECGMAEPADYENVVAITMLQYPRLACLGDAKWDENTEFIAHARADMPLLLAVAEAAAGVADAYRAWDDSLVAGPSPVRLTALLRDVFVAASDVQKAIAPLLEEGE